MFGAKLLQNSKRPEQQMAPATLSKKQARIQTSFTDNQSKQMIVSYVVQQSRVNPKPQFCFWLGQGSSRRNNNLRSSSVHLGAIFIFVWWCLDPCAVFMYQLFWGCRYPYRDSICQDLQGICQEPAGLRLHSLPIHARWCQRAPIPQGNKMRGRRMLTRSPQKIKKQLWYVELLTRSDPPKQKLFLSCWFLTITIPLLK